MKISGFTIARNALKYNYPITESINSILPICDEFIVNVGDSEDATLDLIRSIKSDKIKIIENKWDMSQGKEVLSHQTNLALKACTGDWAFYLQSDEVIHEGDISRIHKCMKKNLNNEKIDALRFYWIHFYGSYYRYRIDSGWYQKQDRIIRNNGQIESVGDAYGFIRKDGQPLKRKNTCCYVYHYGWVQSEDIMKKRRLNADDIGFIALSDNQRKEVFNFTDVRRFPPYFGTHPSVMEKKINEHSLSQEDKRYIDQKLWYYPPRILKIRYKTGKRIKEKIN